MPFFIYLCHDLYIYFMFYIFLPCFIYLCQFQFMLHHYSFMLHQDFHFGCIVFSHLYCINTNLCCINTTNYVVSRFVSSSTFSMTPYSERLSSPGVACVTFQSYCGEVLRKALLSKVTVLLIVVYINCKT